MQNRRNSTGNALELSLFCIKPSIRTRKTIRDDNVSILAYDPHRPSPITWDVTAAIMYLTAAPGHPTDKC